MIWYNIVWYTLLGSGLRGWWHGDNPFTVVVRNEKGHWDGYRNPKPPEDPNCFLGFLLILSWGINMQHTSKNFHLSWLLTITWLRCYTLPRFSTKSNQQGIVQKHQVLTRAWSTGTWGWHRGHFSVAARHAAARHHDHDPGHQNAHKHQEKGGLRGFRKTLFLGTFTGKPRNISIFLGHKFGVPCIPSKQSTEPVIVLFPTSISLCKIFTWKLSEFLKIGDTMNSKEPTRINLSNKPLTLACKNSVIYCRRGIPQ